MSSPIFGQHFQQALPADQNLENSTRQVSGAVYSHVTPKQPHQPKLIALADGVADQLGMQPAFCASQTFVDVFSGNTVLPEMKPFAMCYGGHQFGNWAGQLGDGRAINLGDILGKNHKRWQLQLKGAGPTPYSRFADGLAVLRSSIREFLCSEAMHHLGVPTTRALSLISTGDLVERDMFYDGHPQMEPGAVVCRVAESFLRFGNYEIFAARQDLSTLTTLVEYTLKEYFPEHYTTYQKDPELGVLNWFAQVCDSTCKLVLEWARVGFVHGVLNTDNMSILGLTIDYGPYGWLDNFDPNWTPNTTDAQHRRYRFANQAPIAQWNLLKLANALFPLIQSTQSLETLLVGFGQQYERDWLKMMGEKCGLYAIDVQHSEYWQTFFAELESLMHNNQVDMTLFFRQLSHLSLDVVPTIAQLEAFLQPLSYIPLEEDQVLLWHAWMARYRDKVLSENVAPQERTAQMQKTNPAFILRNYLSQQAIDLAYQGDMQEVLRLLDALQTPYTEHSKYDSYYQKRPDWAKNKAGCSTLSCSS
ncbi:hypothetical protein TDB9533_00064 [Thalassocella blandensis]|nr:hypothetical protein TDB9533_00064 [Thalassocella blandensis]